ncbi:MAG: hypothetical protein KVP17_001106 [Porospora cf. gigantea B]|uniref:uncharacterized protein n=1 Tax=Porospora cf. gigantea B TaxID=2853592 RepID=UPI003571AD14|nr:MAG: hypothetical protein KVP17_001106 [Porospora cf. gigantea B]
MRVRRWYGLERWLVATYVQPIVKGGAFMAEAQVHSSSSATPDLPPPTRRQALIQAELDKKLRRLAEEPGPEKLATDKLHRRSEIAERLVGSHTPLADGRTMKADAHGVVTEIVSMGANAQPDALEWFLMPEESMVLAVTLHVDLREPDSRLVCALYEMVNATGLPSGTLTLVIHLPRGLPVEMSVGPATCGGHDFDWITGDSRRPFILGLTALLRERTRGPASRRRLHMFPLEACVWHTLWEAGGARRLDASVGERLKWTQRASKAQVRGLLQKVVEKHVIGIQLTVFTCRPVDLQNLESLQRSLAINFRVSEPQFNVPETPSVRGVGIMHTGDWATGMEPAESAAADRSVYSETVAFYFDKHFMSARSAVLLRALFLLLSARDALAPYGDKWLRRRTQLTEVSQYVVLLVGSASEHSTLSTAVEDAWSQLLAAVSDAEGINTAMECLGYIYQTEDANFLRFLTSPDRTHESHRLDEEKAELARLKKGDYNGELIKFARDMITDTEPDLLAVRRLLHRRIPCRDVF